jgi:hypothetical protein
MNMESATEKSAEFTPIPSASVRIATAAYPGDPRSCRIANRRSVIALLNGMSWPGVITPLSASFVPLLFLPPT